MEKSEGDVEVKSYNGFSNVPKEPVQNPNKKSNFIWKIIPIILMVIVTIGLIIYVTEFYIPDLKEDIYNETFDNIYNETFDEVNQANLDLENLRVEIYNNGTLNGQISIINEINENGLIPVIQQTGGIQWIALQQICQGV